MTQVFDGQGEAHAVTVIEASPNVVTQVKKAETDGYSAVQVAFSPAKEKRLGKSIKGRLKNLGAYGKFKEFRIAPEELASFSAGQEVSVSAFKIGDRVTVSGVSKGKGFQGVVKRHGFKGGSRTHGQKHSEREAGSIGGGGRAGGRVAKGMRMAGRMGGRRVTVSGLSVIDVSPESRTIVVSGAVPGRRGTWVEVRG